MPRNNQMILATGEGSVIYPVVGVIVNSIKRRTLLDTGAGSSYASTARLKGLTSDQRTLYTNELR